MCGESILFDKEQAMKVIEVSTTRQVAYYFSALQFFKYLTHDKKFTDRAKKISGNEETITNDIYSQLKKDELFNRFYELFKNTKNVDINRIKKHLKGEKQDLSESTVNRRASTIKAWVEWMYSVDNKNNNYL